MSWQPIETAPRDKPILGWSKDDAWPFVVQWGAYDPDDEMEEEGYWYFCEELIGAIGEPCEPTHWMPLPEPPQ